MIARLLLRLVDAVELALFVYVLLSYILPNHDITKLFYRIFEPVLKPVRELLYKSFPQLMRIPFDFSVIVVYLVLGIIRTLIFAIF